MLTVEDLTQLRLGRLQEAVSDWETMVGKLQRLAAGKGEGGGITAGGLAQAANGAVWSGDSAAVTREFVDKTAKEFVHAAAEAKTILGLLRDTHHDFAKHRSDLKAAIADAEKRHIYVADDGTATSAAAPPAITKGKSLAPTQEELDAAAERVSRILWEATETDRIAAKALRDIAKNKNDFRTGGPKDLEEADRQQGKKEAEYWAKKIEEGNVEDWSDAKLARFNEALRNQRDNEQFTATLATSLGGEGTLQFWRDLAAPAGSDIEGDRAKMLAHVQDNMSMSLANATHVDTDGMDQWKRDVVAAGDKQFPIRQGLEGPYGFQVASSLMQKGKFDSGFLNSYGSELIKFEREKGKDETLGNPDLLWSDDTQLDYPPSDKGNDPMTGFLEGLAHNPQASAEFFNGSTDTKGLEKLDNFAYLTGEEQKNSDGEPIDVRKWPEDGEGKQLGYANLGHALESGALGYAYDDKTPEIPPLKTEADIAARAERTDLMHRVVDHYKSAELIDGQPGVRDSLARMAAGHVDSLTYSVSDFGGSRGPAGIDGLLNAEEKRLVDFGFSDSTGFLRALGSDPDSYATVSGAQQVYGASLMAAQGDNHEAAIDAGGYSLLVHGMLDESRMEAIGKDFADDETARNKELEKQAEWRKFAASAAIGTAVGVGAATIVPVGAAAMIAVPLAFEAGGGAAETAWATSTIDWLETKEYSNDQEAIESIDAAQEIGKDNAMTPIVNYAESKGIVGESWRAEEPDLRTMYMHGARQADTDNSRGH